MRCPLYIRDVDALLVRLINCAQYWDFLYISLTYNTQMSVNCDYMYVIIQFKRNFIRIPKFFLNKK